MTEEQFISDSRFNLEPGQMSLFDGLKYILDGNEKFDGAVFSLLHVKKQVKFTYKCYRNTKADGEMYWLFLQTGPDNNVDYTYMGMIVRKHNEGNLLYLIPTTKSKVTDSAESWKLFAYILEKLQKDNFTIANITYHVKMYHNGHCSKCNKHLTDIVSLAVGQGPVCNPAAHKAYKAECKRRGIILPKPNKKSKHIHSYDEWNKKHMDETGDLL